MILNLTSFAAVEKYCTERSGCCAGSRRKVRGDAPRVAAMSCQISLELLLELIDAAIAIAIPKLSKRCPVTRLSLCGSLWDCRREIWRIGCEFPKRRVADRDRPLGYR